MAKSFDASTAPPEDIYERNRTSNVHPPSWINPQPAARYQLAVIGGGPAGLVAAKTATALGAKVALIERERIGGACLNTGSVPSKSMIRTAQVYADMSDAQRFGAQVPQGIEFDFAAVMDRVRRIRAHMSGNESAQQLVDQGIDVFFGEASFIAADAIKVGDQIIRFGKAVIATGARVGVPDIPGLAEARPLNSRTVFDVTELPRRLLIIGGGAVGCEIAQAFCRLGSKTTIVQDMPLFLGNEERDAAQILSDALARDGIEVRLNTNVVAVRIEGGEKLVDLVSDDYRNTIAVDVIGAGVGYVPNVQGLGLEAAGVEYDCKRGIRVDDFMCTSQPNIYAAGDVCLEHRFTHTAEASARIVVQNALFRGHERLSALVLPWCTFTDPEIAHVGLYVREANRLGIPIKTFTIPMHEVDRGVTDSEQRGFVKIHVLEGTDKILGATIVARHAGDMINEITLAIMAGIRLRTLAKVIHAYPTQAEAIQKAAEAYYRTRFTPRIQARFRGSLTR
ncbi:mercuric reductase [Dyella humicola]|uniref:mercuric reductase n=1 Tax=Dyella humicola TaxID=2992126 RepID=UPI00224E8A1D|nr:mercuric reductase [Dyella humicola]